MASKGRKEPGQAGFRHAGDGCARRTESFATDIVAGGQRDILAGLGSEGGASAASGGKDGKAGTVTGGLNILASAQAGFAISYGLGQGATLVAAIWGVFVWREFEAAPRGTNRLLTLMFLAYIVGLILIIVARLAE
jgi:hypothetical protein